jgi:peptide deformylase
MAILSVLTLPEPILRRKSKRVRTIDGSVRKLAEDMIETMHAASGVGLAAPQVGVSLRVIVIGLPEEEDFVLINPEVVRRSGERLVTEGCLSVPGYYGEIKRAQRVTVKGKDLSGKEVRIKAEELLAQALEHEIDHINGVLYIDHLESDEKLHRIEPEITPL